MTATSHRPAVPPTIPVRTAPELARGDEAVADRVRLALARDLGRGSGSITVRAERGVVTLGGCVAWPYQVGMAERCVGAVDGVGSVVNDLRNRRALIAQKIQSAIEIALGTGGPSWIEVNVRPDGTAILYGMVRDEVERQEAEKIATKLSDGFAIQNRLCVA